MLWSSTNTSSKLQHLTSWAESSSNRTVFIFTLLHVDTASLSARASAMSGVATNSTLLWNWRLLSCSSIVHPRPAILLSSFHAASDLTTVTPVTSWFTHYRKTMRCRKMLGWFVWINNHQARSPFNKKKTITKQLIMF